MINPDNTALTRKSSKVHDEWLARLPALNNDEAKLLALMAECYNTFLAGAKGTRELSVEFNIPLDLLNDWARRGKWLQRRDDLRQELLVSVEIEYADFVRRERVGTAEEIVRSVRPLITTIAVAIERALTPDADGFIDENKATVSARRLAESLKHISDVVSKAVGLDAPMPQSDRVAMVPGKQDSGQQAKPAFFNINTSGPVSIGPGGAPAEEKAAIDV